MFARLTLTLWMGEVEEAGTNKLPTLVGGIKSLPLASFAVSIPAYV